MIVGPLRHRSALALRSATSVSALHTTSFHPESERMTIRSRRVINTMDPIRLTWPGFNLRELIVELGILNRGEDNMKG